MGAGETAEVVGKSGLAADRFARLLKYRGDPDAEWAVYAHDARRILQRIPSGHLDHERLPAPQRGVLDHLGPPFDPGRRPIGAKEGRGVPANLELAVQWFDRAAKQGLAPALYRLGSLYEKGQGAKKDLDKGIADLEKIIKEYSGTAAEKDAKALLEELNKRKRAGK